MSLLAATPWAAYQIHSENGTLRETDRILAERKTPMLANITLAGENA